jgi:hypothetical protein
LTYSENSKAIILISSMNGSDLNKQVGRLEFEYGISCEGGGWWSPQELGGLSYSTSIIYGWLSMGWFAHGRFLEEGCYHFGMIVD